ncbi:hypothetical protein TorRG33x02_051710 [Trema orientale]|uniref:Uncharacterized protein n=1 Tax=Trema orientale TaxID=63057 RepID=A0A2P5FMD2_TREOI|nr:hypothetical protein TorRG33x02_051710 [Trema orientale]
MRAPAFLLARDVPSLSREYKDPIREGLFTNRATTSLPPFLQRASSKDTQYSFPALEVAAFRISAIESKLPWRTIAVVPSGFSARVARIARESVTRSSSASADIKRLTSRGTVPAASTLLWFPGCARSPKMATNAFFLPRSVPFLMSSIKAGTVSGFSPIRILFSSTEARTSISTSKPPLWTMLALHSECLERFKRAAVAFSWVNESVESNSFNNGGITPASTKQDLLKTLVLERTLVS